MPETKQLPLVIATPGNDKAKQLASGSIPLSNRLVFGALAGMGAATFCHPLDVIRVQMQTGGQAYKNTFDAGVKIYQRAGVVEGLYVSLSTTCVHVAATQNCLTDTQQLCF